MVIPEEEFNVKKTLETIIKRQENMEENFKKYLTVVRERYEQCDSMKPQTQPRSSIIKKLHNQEAFLRG